MPPKGTECVMSTTIQNFKKMMPTVTKKTTCKIRSAAVFILLALIFAPPVQAEDVVLTWDRPDDSRVTGYKIFYGPADTNFKSIAKEEIDTPEQTYCEIFNLNEGQTYAFAAKSLDQYDNESVFSEVIFYTVPHEQNNNQDDNSDSDNSNSDQGDNTDDSKKHDDGQNNNSTNNAGGGGGGCFIKVTLNKSHDRSF